MLLNSFKAMRYIKYIIIFAAIAIVIAVSFLLFSTLDSPTGYVVVDIDNYTNESKNVPDFRIYTAAICENVSGYILCKDRLFASCNGLEYMIPNDINGTGKFRNNWTDPRIK